ncbi:MAG: F0F1 ATP synthase subunit epsilon [Beggiatoa sp. IS2]|nr:MAG: F0F1 ATP synthase subunit epsilon [Beggiatoa sp. IS2]
MTKALTIHVDIVSGEANIFSGQAQMVIAPAIIGEVGILPRHAPLLTPLKPGEVRIQLSEDREEVFFISGGILEIQPHVVTILADTGVRAHDLDEAAALEAKQQAEKALANKKSDFEYALAEVQLARAMAELQTIQRQKLRTGHRTK